MAMELRVAPIRRIGDDAKELERREKPLLRYPSDDFIVAQGCFLLRAHSVLKYIPANVAFVKCQASFILSRRSHLCGGRREQIRIGSQVELPFARLCGSTQARRSHGLSRPVETERKAAVLMRRFYTSTQRVEGKFRGHLSQLVCMRLRLRRGLSAKGEIHSLSSEMTISVCHVERSRDIWGLGGTTLADPT